MSLWSPRIAYSSACLISSSSSSERGAADFLDTSVTAVPSSGEHVLCG